MISHTVGYVGFNSYKDTPTISIKPGKPHCTGYISEVCKRDIGGSIGNFNRYSTSNNEEYRGAQRESTGLDFRGNINCYEYQHDPTLLKYAANSKSYMQSIKQRRHRLLEEQVDQPEPAKNIEVNKENPLYKSTEFWASTYKGTISK